MAVAEARAVANQIWKDHNKIVDELVAKVKALEKVAKEKDDYDRWWAAFERAAPKSVVSKCFRLAKKGRKLPEFQDDSDDF